jgi:hypothetical protein
LPGLIPRVFQSAGSIVLVLTRPLYSLYVVARLHVRWGEYIFFVVKKSGNLIIFLPLFFIFLCVLQFW